MKIQLLFATFALTALTLPTHAAPDLKTQFPVKAAPTAKKRGASQSQLALKGAFPSVAASGLKGALDAQNLASAKKSVGKVAVFTGVVARIYAPKHGRFALLNFADDYKTALVGEVKAADFRDFPDLKTLKGKRVALRGQVVLFQGLPQVELSAPGAIRVVK